MWHREEKRQLEPFTRVDALLEGLVLHLTANGQSYVPGKYQLDLDAATITAPWIEVSIDTKRLSEELGGAQGIRCGLIARVTGRKQFKMLDWWDLDEIPSTISIRNSVEVFVPNAYPITLAFTCVKAEHVNTHLRHLPIGANLGEQLFEFNGVPAGPDFPVKLVSAEEFERIGLGRECLWAVHTLSDDFNLPPSACFEIWINSQSGEKLQRLFDASPRGRLLSKLLMIDTVADVCRIVFSTDQEPESDDGLIRILFERLSPNGEPSLEELRRIANDAEKSGFNNLVQDREGFATYVTALDVRRGL